MRIFLRLNCHGLLHFLLSGCGEVCQGVSLPLPGELPFPLSPLSLLGKAVFPHLKLRLNSQFPLLLRLLKRTMLQLLTSEPHHSFCSTHPSGRSHRQILKGILLVSQVNIPWTDSSLPPSLPLVLVRHHDPLPCRQLCRRLQDVQPLPPQLLPHLLHLRPHPLHLPVRRPCPHDRLHCQLPHRQLHHNHGLHSTLRPCPVLHSSRVRPRVVQFGNEGLV